MPQYHEDTGIGNFAAAFDLARDAACILEQVGTQGDGVRDWRFIANNSAMRTFFKVGNLAG